MAIVESIHGDNGQQIGWVAERLNAPVLKTGRRESVSWVQIPPHPLIDCA